MLMKSHQVPGFVEDVIAIGCDIWAIGHDHYCFGDHAIPDASYEGIRPQLQRIRETYGERGHLRTEIAAYLRSIGRFTDIGETPRYRAVA